MSNPEEKADTTRDRLKQQYTRLPDGSEEQNTTEYPNVLLLSYEEERIGESFFSHLSLFHDGETKEALRLMAQVERIMSDALVPFVQKRCSHLTHRRGDVMYLRGICEANELSALSSKELATQLSTTFALSMTDIVRLQRLGDFTPSPERAVLQQYLEHEQVIIETLRALADTSSNACASVEGWIKRYS